MSEGHSRPARSNSPSAASRESVLSAFQPAPRQVAVSGGQGGGSAPAAPAHSNALATRARRVDVGDMSESPLDLPGGGRGVVRMTRAGRARGSAGPFHRFRPGGPTEAGET